MEKECDWQSGASGAVTGINLPRGFWMTSHNNKVVFEDFYLEAEAKLQFSLLGQTTYLGIQGFIFHTHLQVSYKEKQSWLSCNFFAWNRNGWENFVNVLWSLALFWNVRLFLTKKFLCGIGNLSKFVGTMC